MLRIHDIPNHFFHHNRRIEIANRFLKTHCCIVHPAHSFIALRAIRQNGMLVIPFRIHDHFLDAINKRISAGKEILAGKICTKSNRLDTISVYPRALYGEISESVIRQHRFPYLHIPFIAAEDIFVPRLCASDRMPVGRKIRLKEFRAFQRDPPLSVQYGVGVPELDTEGRLITLEYEDFFLLTCYTPNAQQELARIDHRLAWDDAFRNYLKELDARKPVIVCGDLNVAHQEIDLKNPKSNRGSAGFSDEERESFTKTLEAGFTDTFRHLYPDATERYTWWSYRFKAREKNAGWRIDYFLVSNRIANKIISTSIYADILGSDHCPVGLELDI